MDATVRYFFAVSINFKYSDHYIEKIDGRGNARHHDLVKH
jgi:hypothetical protein